jgi:hypothetical protein
MKSFLDLRCKHEILFRLSHISPGGPRRWGRMDAHRMVCHLSDAFRGAMGERPVETWRFSIWRAVRYVALYVPVRWPHGIPTPVEIDQQYGGTPPAQFDADMRELLGCIHRFTARPRSFAFQPHPMFGTLSEYEWMRWGYLHTDHHLRQFGQ